MLKAMVVPDLPFVEYRICTFQPSKHREMIYVVLSLAYGTFILFSTVHPPTSALSASKMPWPCLSSYIPRNVVLEVLPLLVVYRAFSTRSAKTPPHISWFSLLATCFFFSSKFLHL